MLPLFFIALLEVHGPDGQTAYINEHEISSLREPTAYDLRHFAPGTHCVVVMGNAKFIATRETCATLRQRLTYP